MTPTWGIMRGERIHFGCATEEELCVTWMGFYGADHPEAEGECERCGIKLTDTPDP